MAVLVIGGLLIIRGSLSLGGFVAFQQLMQRFLEPVNSLVNLGQQLQELVGNINRLDDVLANPIDPQLQNESTEASSSRLQGYMKLRNITFGYSPVAPP